MTPPTPPALPISSAVLRASERLLPTIAAVAAATSLGDFLLWSALPGLGLAIFIASLAALLCLHRFAEGVSRRGWLAAVLLVTASVQTSIEICLTNVIVVLVLLLVLLGETTYRQLPPGWARWWEAVVAICKAPGRWLWLALAFGERPIAGMDRANSLPRLLRIVAPAALLAVLFTTVLGQGNAIFSRFLTQGFDQVLVWLLSFDLSFARSVFWLALATFALAWFRPGEASPRPRLFTRLPSLWQRRDPNVARWQSLMVLAVLNVLFFAVNTIDAVYLWHRGVLPVGVDPKAYIHEGTHSVIAAAVLSAIVLGLLFQQMPEVSRGRGLRLLARLWIAQNLVLLAGAGLRWQLYLEGTGLLTAKRIHLACFLGLVALGFVFLVVHIERGPNLRRLLWSNALATFVLFYVLQFVNTTGFAAHRNVSVWQQRTGGLDMRYLHEQGRRAWPALVRAAQEGPEIRHVLAAREDIEKISTQEKQRLSARNWREIQFRDDAEARSLIQAAEALSRVTR
jgi:hypothetical protein